MGNCTIASGSDMALAKANPIRYRGYYFDVDTGLYYLNARYYSPELRRFISPDDTAYLDPENVDGLNLYVYCCNNPIMYRDNFGCFPTHIDQITTGIDYSLGVYKFLLDLSIKGAKPRTISMEVAKALARKGGHVQSAREIRRAVYQSSGDAIKATRKISQNVDDFLFKFGTAVFILDSAWILGENIYNGNEHWLTDSAFAIISNAIPFAAGVLLSGGWAIFVPIAITAVQWCASYFFEEQIEDFLDYIGDEWNGLWS